MLSQHENVGKRDTYKHIHVEYIHIDIEIQIQVHVDTFHLCVYCCINKQIEGLQTDMQKIIFIQATNITFNSNEGLFFNN